MLGFLLALALAISLSGCAGPKLEPAYASSANSHHYALGYAQELDRLGWRFAADKARAHGLTSRLPAHAAELKAGSEPALLARVIDEADAAGRSRAFASAQEEDRALRTFWEDERGALAARLTSAAERDALHAAGCSLDLTGTVHQTLRDNVEQRLERRRRADSDAQRTLERERARLAAGSLPAVQRLADEIATASYLVHIALVEDVRDLSRVLEERDEVERTLTRARDAEQTRSARTAAEQKARDERIAQLDQARSALGPSVRKVEDELRTYEDQLARARNEYTTTLASLRQRFTR